MSVAEARSFLAPADEAAIRQAVLDGLATSIALTGFSLVLYRTDAVSGQTTPLPPVTVARRWANRQPQGQGSEAATAQFVGGDLRAFAPWDVQPGDAFVMPSESWAGAPPVAGHVVAPIVTNYGVVTAGFVVDSGNS